MSYPRFVRLTDAGTAEIWQVDGTGYMVRAREAEQSPDLAPLRAAAASIGGRLVEPAEGSEPSRGDVIVRPTREELVKECARAGNVAMGMPADDWLELRAHIVEKILAGTAVGIIAPFKDAVLAHARKVGLIPPDPVAARSQRLVDLLRDAWAAVMDQPLPDYGPNVASMVEATIMGVLCPFPVAVGAEIQRLARERGMVELAPSGRTLAGHFGGER